MAAIPEGPKAGDEGEVIRKQLPGNRIRGSGREGGGGRGIGIDIGLVKAGVFVFFVSLL